MKQLLLALIAIAFAFVAQADLVSSFKSLEQKRKGPFDLNMLQGSRGRVVVNQGSPAGTFQFQAAFRNEIGKELATKYDFYTANLFTTNYYELMGEYVYGNPYSSHDLDHAAMLRVGPQALPKAQSMVRHWVLEKHYVHNFPNTRYASAFKLRGIAGSEFEPVFANYFLNFYLTSSGADDFFLPVALLAKGSALADGAQLERARVLIGNLYDQVNQAYGQTEPMVRQLYQIRNAVHNQLSPGVIGQIDTFLRNYPSFYARQTMLDVQSIVRNYYSTNAKRIVELAQKAKATEVQAAAEVIARNGFSIERGLALSKAVANVRANLMGSSSIPYEDRTESLSLVLSSTKYIGKELEALQQITSKDAIVTIINLLYIEGFLIKDNWQYFAAEAANAADVKAAADQIPDIVGIAGDTLTQAFSPSYDQWIKVEPKMHYFMDNTIKSSSLNTASLIIKKIKK